MNSSRALLFCLLLTAGTAHSAAPASDHYELKNRSACVLDPSIRPPFLPIGWKKNQVAVLVGPRIVVPPKPVLDEKDFSVTSILLGIPSFAVINGRSYMEGEFLRLPRNSPLASTRIRVGRIGDRKVHLQTGDQVIEVQMRSQEPGLKRNEEELLNDAR